jgi:hypothetical protein
MPGHSKTLNARQIAFAQNLAVGPSGQGMSLTDAARAAGYKPSPYLGITAARILAQPLVLAEVARLRTLSRASLKLTADTWNTELLYQYAALRDSDRALALAALDKWAKRLGLYESSDGVNSEQAALLTAHLVALAALQRANPQQEKPALTIDARIRGAIEGTAPDLTGANGAEQGAQ